MKKPHLPKTKPPCRLSAAQQKRFWGLTKAEGECLIWQGAVGANGYGSVGVSGSSFSVHRVAWEITNGDILPGMVIDHVVCGNRMCVNPAHLEVVTGRVNSWRGLGHRWSAEASHVLIEVWALPTYQHGDDPSKAWITVNDAAWIIGLQPVMVRKLAHEGEFDRPPGRTPYISRESVTHFVLRRAWEDAGGGMALVLRDLVPRDPEKMLVRAA